LQNGGVAVRQAVKNQACHSGRAFGRFGDWGPTRPPELGIDPRGHVVGQPQIRVIYIQRIAGWIKL